MTLLSPGTVESFGGTELDANRRARARGVLTSYELAMVSQSDVVLSVLRAHHADLDKHGVRSLLLFGSTARNEARDDSDIDLLVDFDRPVGLFALTRLQRDLEHWLGRRVDLVTLDALRPEFRERILREALRAA